MLSRLEGLLEIVSLDIATRSKSWERDPNFSSCNADAAGAILTFTPKSGDAALQMAPMLAAANIASTASIQFGK